MQIGSVIRTYRKEKNLTQAEMAKRLGVSAPAVNKWENGNSLPDVALLSPIARLLGISVDTLLSHEEDLSDEEAMRLVEEADRKIKADGFESAFEWMRRCLAEYPSCLNLILWIARTFDGRRLMLGIPERDVYDAYLADCYTRVLESDEDEKRTAAATSLYHLHMHRKDYDKAEACLAYFSKENPERKCMLAAIYAQTERQDEACKMYEELLYAEYSSVHATFSSLQIMAMAQGDFTKAHMYVDKIRDLARLFEFGAYHEVSAGLELAILEQDEEETLRIAECLLGNLESISAFTKSPLFSHMEFTAPDDSLYDEMHENLVKGFQDEETYAYLKGNKRWAELVG